MNFFQKAKRKLGATATDRLINAESELVLYEFVARRLDSGVFDSGVWAMALDKAEGNDEKAKGIYISVSVKRLKREISAGVGITREYKIFQQRYEEEIRIQKQLESEIIESNNTLIKLQANYEEKQDSRKFWFFIMWISALLMIPTAGVSAIVAVPSLFFWLNCKIKLSYLETRQGKLKVSLESTKEKLVEISHSRL
jgi:hypothetical protein